MVSGEKNSTVDAQLQNRYSPWPHRLVMALALVTFPLIWVGGLVTTYDAGMAVPDWPGTYGYNLLAYPWQTWLAGPWDLFIEHGHRLLGVLAGLVAIGLVLVAWKSGREWVLKGAIGALALVILQGALGGARVLADERLMAMVHGCVGPLFFAYLAGLAVMTSRFWDSAKLESSPAGSRLVRAAWMTVGLAYLQLILGAIVRHVPPAATAQVFRAALVLHLILAAVLVVQTVLTAAQAWRAAHSQTKWSVRRPAMLLAILVVLQVALGVGTYVAKYAWPAWMGDYQFAAAYVVHEKSLLQSLITTGHVANGSLLLFAAVVLAMRSTRLFFHERASRLISRHLVTRHSSAAFNNPHLTRSAA